MERCASNVKWMINWLFGIQKLFGKKWDQEAHEFIVIFRKNPNYTIVIQCDCHAMIRISKNGYLCYTSAQNVGFEQCQISNQNTRRR